MLALEIVSGLSFFSNTSIVGLAINGDTVLASKWRQSFRFGSPRTIEQVRKGESVEQAADRLRATYAAWIAEHDLSARIADGVRAVSEPF